MPNPGPAPLTTVVVPAALSAACRAGVSSTIPESPRISTVRAGVPVAGTFESVWPSILRSRTSALA